MTRRKPSETPGSPAIDSRRLPEAPDFAALDAVSADTADARTRVLALIGNLVFAWSNNESVFIYALMLLLETDQVSAALVFGTLNTARARTDLIRRLAVAKLGEDLLRAELDDLVKRFDTATKLRNELNHAIYEIDGTGAITHTHAMRVEERRGGVRFGATKPMDAARIRTMTAAVEEAKLLNRDLWAYLPRLEAHMRARPPQAPDRLPTQGAGLST